MGKVKEASINLLICIFSVFFGFVIIEIFLSLQTKRETYMNSEESFIKLEMHSPNIKKQVKPHFIYLDQTDAFNEKEKYFLQTDKTGAIVNPDDRNTFYNEKNLKI